MPILLRDGSETQDARLDRLIEFDERSRNFPIREALPSQPRLISRTWASTGTVLDQVAEGSCVGNAFAHDGMAQPVAVARITENTATDLYKLAQLRDEFPDDQPYEGTSTLGGVKAYRERGYCTGYRWAFTIDEVLQTLSYVGPVVIGIWWFESMYETLADGLVEVAGSAVGGHCLLLTGQWLNRTFAGESKARHVVEWKNSWGPTYGVQGKGFIEPADLEWLLKQDGESCVPMGRTFPPTVIR